jgi:hypothetical protein
MAPPRLAPPAVCLPGNPGFAQWLTNAVISGLWWRNTHYFWRAMGYWPNYLRPRTASEKYQHRKVFNRDPFISLCCNKLAARAFALSRWPGLKAPDLLWSGTDPDAIPADCLVPPFIIKPSLASGLKIVVRQGETPDLQAIRTTCRKWLGYRHGRALGEWGYWHQRQHFLVERLLPPPAPGKDFPIDYRLYVYDGKVRLIRTATTSACGRFRAVTPLSMDFGPSDLRYWRGWAEQEADRAPEVSVEPDPPANQALMIEIAEALGAGTDHVRVDLYNIDGEIYFSELTMFGDSGMSSFFSTPRKPGHYPAPEPQLEDNRHWNVPHYPPGTALKRAIRNKIMDISGRALEPEAVQV